MAEASMSRAASLQGAALRLTLALMLGCLVVAGYIVAPVLFAEASSHAQAGLLAGAIFKVCNQGVLVLGAAAAAFYWQLGERRKRVWLPLLLLCLLIAVNAFVLTPIMAELKAAAGPIDALAVDDPQRQTFGMWHGVSAVLHLCASISSAWLIACRMPTGGK
jgi:tryptophan-rich sensory protein